MRNGAIKTRDIHRQSRNAGEPISDSQTAKNPLFGGRAMQIVPVSGKLADTNIDTPFSVFVVSLEQPSRYGNRASGYGTEGVSRSIFPQLTMSFEAWTTMAQNTLNSPTDSPEEP